MSSPLVKELAADGTSVVVTCRVLNLARKPYYRWLAHSIAPREVVEAYRANALFDAHRALTSNRITPTLTSTTWRTGRRSLSGPRWTRPVRCARRRHRTARPIRVGWTGATR